ncbi:MAG: ribbon-helix-helix domain-containing protein [Polyangiaceae bacterium]
MSRKKISSTIYMTPEQSEQLKLLHERTKVPISVYIREGIDLVLKQYEALLPGQMTLVPDTPSTSPSPPAVVTTPKPGRTELSSEKSALSG